MVDPVRVNEAEEAAEETYDTSDPTSVNKQRKKSARTRADRLKFVSAAMDHEEGRAWFYDLLLVCHVLRNPFDADPYTTAFRCGELNIGTRVLDDVQTASPNNYLKMVSENKGPKG